MNDHVYNLTVKVTMIDEDKAELMLSFGDNNLGGGIVIGTPAEIESKAREYLSIAYEAMTRHIRRIDP